METMGLNKEFWKDKRVFITGHTGFKGGWLSLWLQRLGSITYGYSLKPENKENLFEIANVKDGMISKIGNINNFLDLSLEIKKFEPNIVFHMAAQPLVRRSYSNPLETFNTNIIGTANVLESVRLLGHKVSVVNITTDKCYENKEQALGYTEDQPMGGYDPYSSSKGCSELLSSSFRRSFFNIDNYDEHQKTLATARAGNVIGGGDWSSDRLMTDILYALNKKKILKLRNPTSTRPWQHVLEPVYGYLMLAQLMYDEGPEFGEAWNFGPNPRSNLSVKEIVNKMNQFLSENKIRWEIDRSKNSHEAKLLMLNITKAKKRLGWKPQLSIEDSLKLVLDWNDAYSKNKKMKDFTLEQIEHYENLLRH